MTRGAELTGGTMNAFKVTAILDDAESTEFMKDEEVSLSSGVWTYSPVKYWPHQEKVHFFAYSSSNSNGILTDPEFVEISEGVFQAKFKYTLPYPTADNKDAENQPDLVFAFQPSRKEEDGTVEFAFSHALSSIQFKVGNVPGGSTLESIDFVNVRSIAECVVTFDADNGISFLWDEPEELSYVILKQQYPSLPLLKDAIISDITKETTFMMIPQEFDDEAYLRIVIKEEGSDEESIRNVYLKDIHPKWLPGEIHTYTISLE